MVLVLYFEKKKKRFKIIAQLKLQKRLYTNKRCPINLEIYARHNLTIYKGHKITSKLISHQSSSALSSNGKLASAKKRPNITHFIGKQSEIQTDLIYEKLNIFFLIIFLYWNCDKLIFWSNYLYFKTPIIILHW